MKKNTAKKNSTARKAPAPRTARQTVAPCPAAKPCFNPWSLSIYIYWFIILFFIAATFYILGRSHSVINKQPNLTKDEVVEVMGEMKETLKETVDTPNDMVEEEKLLSGGDYYNAGKSKMLSGDMDGAIKDLTTAIESGADTDAYVLRGEIYMQTGNYRAAMSDFDTAIKTDASSAVAYYDRALLNTRLENYNAALNDINNSLAVVASNPTPMLQLRDLYAKRGQLNLWLKNWDGAVADYTNSLARPDGVVNPTVYAERAEAYTALGNYAAAIADYESAVRVISEQIQGTNTIEERESLSSNAMAYFEKSAALNLNLGNIAAARTDLQAARTIAVALSDAETIERLDKLIAGLN